MIDKEKTLLTGCLNGEKAAWDAFVLQYSKLVYNSIRKTLSLYHAEFDEAVIDDLHQDFFVAMMRNDFHKLRQFRGDHGCTLASWVKVVATCLTVDLLRKRKSAAIELTDNIPAEQTAFADDLMDQEQERFLQQAFDDLSDRDKLLIDLHFRKGLDPNEIAAIMHVSASVVYTQKSRLIARLRETLKKLGAL